MITEPLSITLLVIDALEKLNVPYLIGGSLASALHGVEPTSPQQKTSYSLSWSGIAWARKSQIDNGRT